MPDEIAGKNRRAFQDAGAALSEELERRGYKPHSPTDRDIIDALPDVFDALAAAGILPARYRGFLIKAGHEARRRFGLPGYNDRMSLRINTTGPFAKDGKRGTY